jgi:hypothetical protein
MVELQRSFSHLHGVGLYSPYGHFAFIIEAAYGRRQRKSLVTGLSV